MEDLRSNKPIPIFTKHFLLPTRITPRITQQAYDYYWLMTNISKHRFAGF